MLDKSSFSYSCLRFASNKTIKDGGVTVTLAIWNPIKGKPNSFVTALSVPHKNDLGNQEIRWCQNGKKWLEKNMKNSEKKVSKKF